MLRAAERSGALPGQPSLTGRRRRQTPGASGPPDRIRVVDGVAGGISCRCAQQRWQHQELSGPDGQGTAGARSPVIGTKMSRICRVAGRLPGVIH